jgi:hypothetical protein
MNKQPVVLNEATADWEYNYADYKLIGAITASIEDREDNTGDLVGVFVDGDCRGIAERMYFPFDDSYMYILQVYSNVEGEELTFKYYDSVNDEVIEYTERLTFENYMVVGDGFDTYNLRRESRDGVIPSAYGISEVYPNPFNPVTSFEYTVPEDGMVQVAVFDINGRMVAELINGYITAGTYPVTWNASDLSSGIYMLHMISGDFSTLQKMMLIK